MQKIKHEAFIKIIQRDYGESFKDILESRTLSSFEKTIEGISKKASSYGYSDTKIEDEDRSGEYKFIGDLFEIFAEAFFIQFSSDNRVGIYNYMPVLSEDDNGVDGYGLNINGDNATVQVKYRGNPIYLLKERDLKQFGFQSIINYNVDYNKDNNMIVFTNCQGLHWYTDKNVFNSKIKVINGNMISKMIDNNEGFWDTFKNLIIKSIEELKIPELMEPFQEN